MYGIQILVWPALGLAMGAAFLLMHHRAKSLDLLLGSAFAASVGGALGYLAAIALFAPAAAPALGLVGAMAATMVSLVAAERRAQRVT
jgi:hypothetical protein